MPAPHISAIITSPRVATSRRGTMIARILTPCALAEHITNSDTQVFTNKPIMKILKRIALSLCMLTAALCIQAQTAAVKTNLLGWASTTLNVGAELGVGPKSTVQLFASLNPWEFGDTRLRFWNIEPEYRYWFCEKFNGHFVGIHALGGEYNLKNVKVPLTNLPDLRNENKGRHIEGWYAGAGITYGYQWMLSHHWNLEASIGVGYAYSPYKYFGRCDRLLDKDGNTLPNGTKKSGTCHYVGPTKLAVSIMYVF